MRICQDLSYLQACPLHEKDLDLSTPMLVDAKIKMIVLLYN